jgi:hypothetical protein
MSNLAHLTVLFQSFITFRILPNLARNQKSDSPSCKRWQELHDSSNLSREACSEAISHRLTVTHYQIDTYVPFKTADHSGFYQFPELGTAIALAKNRPAWGGSEDSQNG